ncbi:MAG: hypothetical protein JW763_06380 [candidate division Zixibacteria bacterium]|nr:hypothetical protein [candidate division Zixibacteria bacterium]
MAEWSKNNAACLTTWITLRVLEQSFKVFNDSAAITMKELAYWNTAASDDMRKIQATTLAHQLDNIFIKIRCARYEEGKTAEQAVSDTVTVLIDADKTMNDLAAVIDANYLFLREQLDD